MQDFRINKRDKPFLALPPEMERRLIEARKELNKGAWSDEGRIKLYEAIVAGKTLVAVDGWNMAITYHGDHVHCNAVNAMTPCGTYELENVRLKLKDLQAAA